MIDFFWDRMLGTYRKPDQDISSNLCTPDRTVDNAGEDLSGRSGIHPLWPLVGDPANGLSRPKHEPAARESVAGDARRIERQQREVERSLVSL